jgi:hypothetical protein
VLYSIVRTLQNLLNEDCLVSFAFVSLVTYVLVEESLQIIRNRLSTDPSFPERSPLQVEDICLTATCFQFEDQFYQQKEGMAMGISISAGQQYVYGTL